MSSTPANNLARRILLVDDSGNERMVLASLLRKEGYAVEEAADGKAAIDQLKNHEFNAVLLDLHMPVLDGFDVLSYLQKHRRALPVSLLSGMPVEDIQREIHGLPDHELPPLFLKPVDVGQLLEVLELQLRGELPDAPKADDNPTNGLTPT